MTGKEEKRNKISKIKEVNPPKRVKRAQKPSVKNLELECSFCP